MACGCKGRAGTVTSTPGSGTYRVMVSGRQVYESNNPDAAKKVAGRFEDATILEPGKSE